MIARLSKLSMLIGFVLLIAGILIFIWVHPDFQLWKRVLISGFTFILAGGFTRILANKFCKRR